MQMIPSFALIATALFTSACVSTDHPTTFTSPELAVETLIGALRANDMARARAILGPMADEVLDSGDAIADRNNLEEFVAAYDEKHQVVDDGDRGRQLLVGASDWPMPIPLVADGGRWSFDTSAGLDELLSRRIGRNELDAIQTCLAVADAQNDYAHADPDGDGIGAYAERVISEPGKKNGLYWPTREGEPESPLGSLVALASEEGYAVSPTTPGDRPPFHGYFFKLLKSQGPSADGGEIEYVLNGKMIGGFALVAWPAEYGNSGIMTFMVNHAGVVFQKDLGSDTAATAKAIVTFSPGAGWKKVE